MLSALVLAGSVFAMSETPNVSVTIYSAADPRGFDPQQFAAQQRMGADPSFAWQVPGFGVVREIRTISLQPGRNDVPFADVAAFIDPTTVSFADLTDPSTVVLEQNFQFDLVSPSKLYERYLGEAVTLVPAQGESISGTLLAANQGQFVVQTPQGLRVVPQAETQVALGALPGGLITKPTLVWKIDAKQGGEHRIRTSYQTAGMTWRADYNLVLAPDDTLADLTPWVTLMNVSGAGFRDAQLRLVAGDVQRIRPERPMMRARGMEMAMAADAGGFVEEQLFEYHLYTLPRPTDILANSSMQLALFPPIAGVPVTRELVYIGVPQFTGWSGPRLVDQDVGGGMNTKVSVFVKFRNDEASGLGMPLPKGRVRVLKQSSGDGTLEFVGEDVIDHTPRNGELRLKLGNSFDVTGERVQTDFRIDNARREMVESFRITLRNGRRNAEQVQIRESLYRWSNWEIQSETKPHTKLDARTIAWDVEVPPEGSTVVEYRVRYTW